MPGGDHQLVSHPAIARRGSEADATFDVTGLHDLAGHGARDLVDHTAIAGADLLPDVPQIGFERRILGSAA
jgi:hypothetical protein